MGQYRLMLIFDKSENEVLQQICQEDCRPAREELRFLLREEARRRGLLPISGPELNPAASKGAASASAK